jgi:hypothetical protein
VTGHVRLAEPGRAPLEQPLGVVLGELLAPRVELARVAHVRQRERCTGLREDLRQRERVVVI